MEEDAQENVVEAAEAVGEGNTEETSGPSAVKEGEGKWRGECSL